MAIYLLKVMDSFNSPLYREYVIDYDDDLQTLPGLDQCCVGSRAMSIESLTHYIINSDGEWVEDASIGGGNKVVSTEPQDLTEAQKIQALLNVDGVRIVKLEDGTITLEEIAAQIGEINERGEHVFFDTAALAYPLYLCTIAINYDENDVPVSYRLNDLVSGNIAMGAYDGTMTLADVLAGAVNAFYTLTVTAETQDGVTVTGQTVTVRATDASGAVYATAAYEGQPVSFSLPNGFAYYVSITSNLAGHFNPTTASGIVSGADVSVVLTYSDVQTIKTFEDIKAALQDDLDLTDLVGQEVTWTSVRGTESWIVDDYEGGTNPTVGLEFKDTLPTQMNFNPPQALLYLLTALPAGAYSFKQNASTTYYFELTQEAPIGAQIRATTAQFWVYESVDATTAAETGSVSTTAIAGATDLGTCGQGDVNHWARVNYGSNNFKQSWLFVYINSDCANGTQLRGTTGFDRPMAAPAAGFLNGVPASTLACIDNTVWKCSANNTYEAPASVGSDIVKQTTYTVTAKIGLLSEKEVFGSYGGTDAGDSVLDLYKDATADDRKKYYNSSARYWWLRSPHRSTVYYERYVGTSGVANGDTATNSYGVVPACKISKLG